MSWLSLGKETKPTKGDKGKSKAVDVSKTALEDESPPVPPRRTHSGQDDSPPAPPPRPPRPEDRYVKPNPPADDQQDDYDEVNPIYKVPRPLGAATKDAGHGPGAVHGSPGHGSSTTQAANMGLGFTLATAYTSADVLDKLKKPDKGDKVTRKESMSKFLNIFKGQKFRRSYENQPVIPVSSKQPEEEIEPEDAYDEVEDMKLDPSPTTKSPLTHKTRPKQQIVKPTVFVKPTSKSTDQCATETSRKPFFDLNYRELVERLMRCHMVTLAGICEREHFDGSFFKNISDSELKKDFKLSNIDIVKLKKMRDENWVVSE